MNLSKILACIFLLYFTNNYSQQKYIVKYENGKIKIEGYLKNNTLDSIYKEYYENGNLKKEGFYKNCEYKTNKIGIYLASCGVRIDKDTIKIGKRHGNWKIIMKMGI